MSAFLSSTRVDILRGTTTDVFGDEADTDTVVQFDVYAAVREGRIGGFRDSQETSLPASQRGGQVEDFTVRMPPNTDVREGDRLQDQRTGAVYLVQDVFSPQSAVLAADIRVTAVRISSGSLPVAG